MKKVKKYAPYIIIVLIITFFSTIALNSSPLFKGIQHNDSSVFQIMGKGVLNGKVMYKDLFDHKGPIMYFINALAILINKNIGVFIIEIVSFTIGSFYIYKTSRLMLNEKPSLLITIIYISLAFMFISGGNFTEEYAINLTAIAMYYIAKVQYKKDDKRIYWIIIGLTFALTFFIKPTYIAIWVAFGVTEFIFSIIEKRFTKLLKNVVYIIIGIAICTVPVIMYLSINNDINDFINSYFIMNMKYSDSTFIDKMKNLIKLLKQEKYIIFIILVIIESFILNSSLKTKKYIKIYVDLFFVSSLILTGWSTNCYRHYLIQLAPSITLINIYTMNSIILFIKTNKKVKQILKQIPLNFIYTITILIILLNIGYISRMNNGILSTDEKKGIKDKECLDKIKPYIGDGDLFVIGNQPYYYIYLNKYPKFKYFFQIPIIKYDSNIRKETEKYILNEKPKIIIILLEENRPIFEQLYGKEVVNFLEENYTKYDEKIEYYILKEE